jgi:hypothetical protein
MEFQEILKERAAKQKKDLEFKRQWEKIRNMKYVDIWKKSTQIKRE